MAIIKITADEYKKKFGVQPFSNEPVSGMTPNQSTQHQSVDVLKYEQAKAEKEANKGLLGRTIKGLPGAALEVGVGGPARLATSLGEGINTTFKTGGQTSASGKTYDLPGLAPFESFQSEADRKAKEGVSPINNILSTGAKTVQAGLDTIGLATGVAKAGKGIIALNETKNTNKIWNLIQPKLSALDQAEAVKSGQIGKVGLTRKVAQLPDQEMITAARPYLKTTDPIKATAQMQEGIATEANRIRSGLQQSKAIWNRNELKGVIAKIEQPHLLTGDVQKAYIKTLQAALKEAETAPKTLEGLLDVRQSFDRIVAKQYPNLYSSDTLTPIKSAVMDTRRAINNLIEAKLPETANKTMFVQSLRNQSLLYKAIDNVATKAPKIGTSVLTNFGKFKKGVIRGAEVVLGYEGVKKLLGK